MTVSKLYEYMSEKVVPESVMPQNITSILADDDEPMLPELDAFTFLTRVRALGIGSADFLYLLKGCGAPKAAVDKIENNPAMNLQSLIVTLDGSGLTSQDYTRMLYTARQIWERTLTMRIEKAQPVEDTDEDFTEEIAPADEDFAEELSPADEDFAEELSPDYEDFAEEVAPADEDFAEEIAPAYEDFAEELSHADEDFAEEVSPTDEDFTEELSPTNEDFAEEVSPTDEDFAEELSPTDEDFAEEVSPADEDFAEEIAPADEDNSAQSEKPILTGKQYTPNSAFEAYYDENKPVMRHNGKIAAAAVGAALLASLAITMDCIGFAPAQTSLPTAQFAESEEAVFAEIYYAYQSGNIGGENIFISDRDSTLFGNMLISSSSGICGSYAVGDSVFSVSADIITVYIEEDSALSSKTTITPPQGAEFIEVTAAAQQLIAVFAGENSAGFAAYDEDGKQLFITEQYGVLTDYTISDDSVSFGTVYIPDYNESFTVSDTEKYLPLYEAGGQLNIIPAENIIADGENNGCGYAVYGEYSQADGSAAAMTAALGNPVYSGAEKFMAAMKTANGYRLIQQDNSGSAELAEISGLIACDMGDVILTEVSDSHEPYDDVIEAKDEQPIIATAQKDENGEIKIYLRGFDFKPVSVITGVPEEMTSISIDEGILYICGENGVLSVADISQPESPILVEFTRHDGIVREDCALTYSLSDSAVDLILYAYNDLDEIYKAASCTKVINPAEGKYPEICGNTLFISGESLAGAAFRYFDGVSMVSQYAVFGKTNTEFILFDDKNGFSAAVETNNAVYLIYGDKSCSVSK